MDTVFPNLHDSIPRPPLVELHRHLEGCISPGVWREARRRFSLKAEPPAFLKAAPTPDPDLRSWLQRFHALQALFDSPEVLACIAGQVVQAMEREGIAYGELRFSPGYMGARRQIPLDEVIEAVSRGVRVASRSMQIMVPLIVVVSREMGPDLAAKVVDEALLADDTICGIDLAGAEDAFPSSAFVEAVAPAKEKGLPVLVHAGEIGALAPLQEAMEVLEPRRIGHGIACAQDPATMETLMTSRTPLELCLSSNVFTGAVPSLAAHPLKTIADAGVSFSINTDDPALFATTLPRELELAAEILGWNEGDLLRLQMATLDQGLAPDADRGVIRERLQRYWHSV